MCGLFRLGEHQVFASSMIDWSECIGLSYEAGTGKTMCALDAIYRAVQRGDVHDALVVCPASMCGTWRKAVRKMEMFEGYTEDGIRAVEEALAVTSFQRVYKSVQREVHHRNGTVSYRRELMLREDVDRPWDIIVVDESHCIGAHNSVQTNACITLGGMADKRVVMSGTPVSGGGGKQDWKKLYGQIKFLNPAEFRNWTDFKSRYVMTFDPWGNPSRYNEEACEELFKRYFIVARLRDCYDMPDYTDTEVPCELAEKRVYTDIKKGRVSKYGLRIDNAGGAYLKLLQLCSGHMKQDDKVTIYKTSKLDALEDIIRGTDDKVVIFCNYRASIERVQADLGMFPERTVVFDGRSKGETWREFQEGDARFLICQYQAGGVGIDLFASATMVLYEPCLSSLLLEQTKARIMRKGQERHCQYLYLYTPGTIEERVWDKVRSGVDVTRKMLDDWAHE